MAWKDLQARIRGFFGGREEIGSRRPDGGTSCYRPMQRRNREEEELAREKAAEYAAGQPATVSAHSGFTGMNPPSGGTVPGQNTLGADPYGYGAAQAARQEAWGRGYAAQNQAPEYASGQTGYAPNQESAAGYAAQNQAWGTGYAPGAQNQGMPDNISYMPGVHMPEAGSS